LKSRTLLADIVWAKPAFDIKEGVFYDKIDGFAIKIGKKEADSIIKDVIIYERGANLQDNFIIAKSGVMRTTENKRLLEFNLKDGWRYQERGDRISKNTELIRIGFREYKKQFDLGSLGLRQRTSDTVNKNNQRMQSMSQLRQAIDSIEKEVKKVSEKVNREVFSVFMFSKYFDTGYMKPDISGLPAVKDFDQLIPDSSRRFVNQQAGSLVSSTTLNSEIAATEYNSKQKELRLHKIEWHKKITLSLACMVLFLIGAPLGAIIRKGGLGTPLVFAVIFFIFFYFFSTTGEKYVKENILTSFGGMWMATMVLVPVGVFLTYKALHDSQLFNKEFYFRFWKKLKLVLRRNKA
jgi:lipopolysaccharide export system permease protein